MPVREDGECHAWQDRCAVWDLVLEGRGRVWKNTSGTKQNNASKVLQCKQLFQSVLIYSIFYDYSSFTIIGRKPHKPVLGFSCEELRSLFFALYWNRKNMRETKGLWSFLLLQIKKFWQEPRNTNKNWIICSTLTATFFLPLNSPILK